MNQLEILVQRYPRLEACRKDIQAAYELLSECFAGGHTLYIAGNGGSCADAEHIVGELMKSFKKPRTVPADFAGKLRAVDSERGKILATKLQRGLRAVALHGEAALNTAFLNDVAEGGNFLYAEQLYGYGKEGDVFLGISTSGGAENIAYAAVTARALGMKVLGLTGESGGKLARLADLTIKVPETETYMIQELHLPVYHCLCLMLEEKFFAGE